MGFIYSYHSLQYIGILALHVVNWEEVAFHCVPGNVKAKMESRSLVNVRETLGLLSRSGVVFQVAESLDRALKHLSSCE